MIWYLKVCLRPIGEFLGLKVPGLSEGRPSVLVGDRVIVSAPGCSDYQPEYEGFVHEVRSHQYKSKFLSHRFLTVMDIRSR